jgi:adenosine kinase
MKKIVAFGNPLLDTIVLIEDDVLLKKYNLKSDGQKEISQDEMKSLMNDIDEYEKTVTAGGCAQNTLKVIQWLLQGQCSTTIFGAIGSDNQGETLKQILKSHGVKTNYVKHERYYTGTTVSLVTKQGRSLVACLSAAEIISLNDVLNTDIIVEIRNADLIYIEGFFLTKRFEAAKYILNYCNELEKKIAFNLSGEYLCNECPEIVEYFIERCEIIIGNRREFSAICSIMRENDVESFISALSQLGKTVVLTNGPSYVICVTDRGKINCKTTVPEVEKKEVVDTTGAGDSFAAGFLTGYLTGRSIQNCLNLGCYAAQEIIRRRGCVVPEHPPNLVT